MLKSKMMQIYREPREPQKTYKIGKTRAPVKTYKIAKSKPLSCPSSASTSKSNSISTSTSPPGRSCLDDGDFDDVTCNESVLDTDLNFQLSVDVDQDTIYQLELRKQKCLVAVDVRFVNVAFPDFDTKKCKLKDQYVVVSRRYFMKNDGIWIYYCSCDKINSSLIKSLNFDAEVNQNLADMCIHIRAINPIILEVDYWDENEDLLAYQEDCLRDNDISQTFDKSKLLVIFNGSPGVVSYNGTKYYCHLCLVSFCKHCAHVKVARQKDSLHSLDEFFSQETHLPQSKNKKAISQKRIRFAPDEQMKRNLASPPSVYLEQKDGVLICEDSDVTCCGEIVLSNIKVVKLFTKNFLYSCEVRNKVCTGCSRNLPYDGNEDSIMNMGKFLFHYSLLRDYMFHYLHGKSCTLHGYYEVFVLTQKSSGNDNIQKEVSYNDFKDCWYAFLSLLEIDYKEGFTCVECGDNPNTIICDATSLGLQKRFATIALYVTQGEVIKRTSKHDARIAIAQPKLRTGLKNWVCGKENSERFLAEMRKLYPSVYNVMKWSREVFGSSLPSSIYDVFKCLYSPSPVCSYFKPSDTEFALAKKLTMSNIKSSIDDMKKIQLHLPLFFKVLVDLTVETALPEVWEGLILYLIDKAKQPFKGAVTVDVPVEESDQGLGCFPKLPILRERGNYQQDYVTAGKSNCRKNYNGHPNLTSGIFTIYCPHGICYGFEVMDKEESPNIPFTIFKTRFLTAPRLIVYDNNCSLHAYCLNRDPYFFKNTVFLIDRFHWKNHTACAPGYCMDIYPEHDSINSQINEQQNAATKRLKTQLSYMRPDNFLNHCKFFIWYRNLLKSTS